MKERIFNYFSNPVRMSILNGMLLTIAVGFNLIEQVFCIPVSGAIPLIAICFVYSTLFPILVNKKSYLPIVSLMSGVSFCLFVYCIIFLAQMNYLALIMLLAFGLGLITFIPHFFALQLLWKSFIKQPSKTGRRFFLLGILIPIIICICSSIQYQKGVQDMEAFQNSGFTLLNKTYMTERLLGVGVIYHTEFCEYDGWRPPKHDPFFNIGYWLNGSRYPIRLGLKDRVQYYKQFFPNKTVKFNCSCAYNYKEDYHQDKLWD